MALLLRHTTWAHRRYTYTHTKQHDMLPLQLRPATGARWAGVRQRGTQASTRRGQHWHARQGPQRLLLHQATRVGCKPAPP
jgi:hypothetical protein